MPSLRWWKEYKTDCEVDTKSLILSFSSAQTTSAGSPELGGIGKFDSSVSEKEAKTTNPPDFSGT